MIVNSEQSLSNAIIELKNDYKRHKWVQQTLKTCSRTLKQNAWINQAYRMLEMQGDLTFTEYRRYCKYTFGMPILMGENEKMANIWRQAFRAITYEERLVAMDNIGITSEMKPDEAARYINEIINHYAPQGFELPSKENM